LFYIIENNHLHPIEDKQMQNSLAHTQTKSCKMHHMRKEEKTERKVHVFTHPKEILIMIGLVPYEEPYQQFDFIQCGYDIFVCTTSGIVHDLFYQCLKFGKLFNRKDCVRMESSRVYRFNIGNITIQENKD